MKCKKAMEWQVIVFIILIIAFLVFALFLYGGLAGKMREYLFFIFG